MRTPIVISLTAVITATLTSLGWLAFYPYVVEHGTVRRATLHQNRAEKYVDPHGSGLRSIKSTKVHVRPSSISPASTYQTAAASLPRQTETNLRIGQDPKDILAKHLTIPVEGIKAEELRPAFYDDRGQRGHEAIDIPANRGQTVIAVEDGKIAKLFSSVRGGLTIYQFDPSEKYAYYYAHLDRYADGLSEGAKVLRGQVIGYVGSTGNADPSSPHLHFAIFILGAEKQWWKGEAIDPYPALTQR
jgi:murein DD-endopeptidase MepM/ murein hydrolase activator NlpD